MDQLGGGDIVNVRNKEPSVSTLSPNSNVSKELSRPISLEMISTDFL